MSGALAKDANIAVRKMLTELRYKHEVSDTGAPPPVRSTVGLVLDGTFVTMVVPGGPAYKSLDGHRIEKGDRGVVRKVSDV